MHVYDIKFRQTKVFMTIDSVKNKLIEQIRIKQFSNLLGFPHYWAGKGFKGTIVNRAAPLFYRRLFEIKTIFGNFWGVNRYIKDRLKSISTELINL